MRDLRVGVVIGTDVNVYWMPFHHVGVVSDIRGRQVLVVSKSWAAGGVVEQPLDVFAEASGRYILHERLWGDLPGWRVAENAYDRLDEAWYPTANCEHFVREVHGLPSASPQLQKYGKVAAGATAFGLVTAPFTGPLVAGALGLTGAVAGARRR